MYSDHVHMLNLTGMWEGGVQDLYLERCFITICSSHFSLCFCSFLSLLLNCQLPEGRSHQFSSVAQSCPTLCNPKDCRTPGFPVYHQLWSLLKLIPLSQWCLPTISSFVIPFSSCLQSFPDSGAFSVRQFFTSGVQSMGVSASA